MMLAVWYGKRAQRMNGYAADNLTVKPSGLIDNDYNLTAYYLKG